MRSSATTDADYGKLKYVLSYVIQSVGEALRHLESDRPLEAEEPLYDILKKARDAVALYRCIQNKDLRQTQNTQPK